MDTPHPTTWGPALWMILHSSAERWGMKQYHRMPHEEARIWSNLLQSLRYALPCPQCKKHYQAYYATHPLSASTKDEIRGWLYRLHHDVNVRNGKPDGMLLGDVEAHYSAPFSFSEPMGVVVQQMRGAVRKGWVSREDMYQVIRHLEEMKRFYDFF